MVRDDPEEEAEIFGCTNHFRSAKELLFIAKNEFGYNDAWIENVSIGRSTADTSDVNIC